MNNTEKMSGIEDWAATVYLVVVILLGILVVTINAIGLGDIPSLVTVPCNPNGTCNIGNLNNNGQYYTCREIGTGVQCDDSNEHYIINEGEWKRECANNNNFAAMIHGKIYTCKDGNYSFTNQEILDHCAYYSCSLSTEHLKYMKSHLQEPFKVK